MGTSKLREYIALFAAILTLVGIGASAHPFILIFCYLVHEAGHLLFARVCGAQIKKISVGVFKLALGYDSAMLSYKREFLVCFGGILFNLLFAILALALPLEKTQGVEFFLACNFSLALINLYPVSILDGARLLKLTLLGMFSHERAEKISNAVSFVAVILLWLFAIYFQLVFSANISTFVISVFLLIQLCFSL